jgi:thiol:disulfide interchange protein DsbC
MSTSHNSNSRLRHVTHRLATIGLLAACSLSLVASAEATEPVTADPATVALTQSLQQRYPNTKFGEIKRTPMPGVWEVWMGANSAYVTDEGRYFIFGHLFDMQTQTDLTAGRQDAINARQSALRPKISFADLPLNDAIKTVRGTGERKLAVFSDPDCPYCQKLEGTLDKLTNVTIYTFLFPIESLHPEAATKSEAIWCAKDRAAAWKNYMAAGKTPVKSARCETPIEKNVALANRAGVQGTPFIFFGNGEKAAGAQELASLERYLAK